MKTKFGFIDPGAIMGVVVSLIILAVGVFAFFVTIDSIPSTNARTSSAINNTIPSASCGVRSSGCSCSVGTALRSPPRRALDTTTAFAVARSRISKASICRRGGSRSTVASQFGTSTCGCSGAVSRVTASGSRRFVQSTASRRRRSP